MGTTRVAEADALCQHQALPVNARLDHPQHVGGKSERGTAALARSYMAHLRSCDPPAVALSRFARQLRKT
jgi:hypothetical protein